MSELSEILRLKREELKKTIKNVAKDTKIREQYIILIEQASYELMPSYLHAYGFVKQYAEYLGLDYCEVVKPLFDKECPKRRNVGDDESGVSKTISKDIPDRPVFVDYSRSSSSKLKVVLLVLVIAAIVGVIAAYSVIFSPTDYTTQTTVPVTSSDTPAPKPVTDFNTLLSFADNKADNTTATDNATQTSQLLVNTVDVTSSPATVTEINDQKIEVARKQRESLAADAAAQAKAKEVAASASNTPKRLLLTFTGDCWVQYTADNLPPVEYSGSAGQSKAVTFVDNFSIDIGNAAGISFSYGRQKFENFGGDGTVVKNLKYKIVDGVLVREQR